METRQQRSSLQGSVSTSTSVEPTDVAVGAVTVAVEAAVGLARRARPFVEPLARVALSPPLVPRRLQPGRWLDTFGRRGAEQRTSSYRDGGRLLDELVPVVVEGLVRRVDLTTVVTRYVDLDGVVAKVDLDAAASRLDIDLVARRLDLDAVLDRIDLTEVVLKRVDLSAVVRAVLADLDLTAVVLERVDLDAVAQGLDLDAIARRLDLDTVLDRLDLTAVVLERVDLDALVKAVLDRIDLVGLADEVIDAVDLPGIIRESTGSMASDTVRGARMQGIAADEAVSRVRDRLLLRRGHRPPGGPGASTGDRSAPPEVPPQTQRPG